MHDSIPARAHATAMGFYYCFVNLFAAAPAFTVVGAIADRFGLLAGMHAAVAAQVAGRLGFVAVLFLIRWHGLHHPAMAAYRLAEASAGGYVHTA